MDERISRESVEKHLAQVLASRVFERAELQARALRILARAALEGRVLKGVDLSRKIYGRSGRAYLRATQQVVREIRLKLPLYYASAPGDSILFEIAPDRHELVIRRRIDESGSRSGGDGAGPEDGLPRIHT